MRMKIQVFQRGRIRSVAAPKWFRKWVEALLKQAREEGVNKRDLPQRIMWLMLSTFGSTGHKKFFRSVAEDPLADVCRALQANRI